jgi:hypothetical protein
MRRALALVGGLVVALPAGTALLAGTAGPALADDGQYNCTDSNGGTSSLCERTHSLSPLGWAVVIALVLIVLLGVGWWLRLRQRRRARVERAARRGWRRLFGRRRRRVIDRY